jgi:hypothetical protein
MTTHLCVYVCVMCMVLTKALLLMEKIYEHYITRVMPIVHNHAEEVESWHGPLDSA